MTNFFQNLNFRYNFELLKNLGIELNDNVNIYNEKYKEYLENPENVKKYINEQIISYINKNYTLINIINADINYYIEHINLFLKNKFSNIISELNINHIISMIDYSTLENETYHNTRNLYYNIIYDKIIYGEYKIVINNNKTNLINLIKDNWNKINFNNLIEFTCTINKINFFGQNVDEFINIIKIKFDDKENILKLLDYINKIFIENNDEKVETLSINNIDDIDNIDNINNINNNLKKFNFRFIVDNLKSNGYLLFEEYNKQLKSKYKKQIDIKTIIKNKKLINYFIYLVSKKNSNTVNRQVNEILIRIRDYIYDLEDSYNNNIAYQKINVKQESDKYKYIDLNSYNRSNATFNIFKYSNVNLNLVNNFKLTSKIEPYFDIYKSYYNSRYPDREIEFNPFLSTMIIKMKFLDKNYYIHIALIQYIVLDIIFNSFEGINLESINKKTDIPFEHIQETINSLLKIKIIKYSKSISVETLNFFINYDFTNENNKISISSLIIKESIENCENKNKEYLFDRNVIILANIYDFVKKNNMFTFDIIINNIQHNIPFKLTDECIHLAIRILIDKEHLKIIDVPNNTNITSQQMYQYIL